MQEVRDNLFLFLVFSGQLHEIWSRLYVAPLDTLSPSLPPPSLLESPIDQQRRQKMKQPL